MSSAFAQSGKLGWRAFANNARNTAVSLSARRCRALTRDGMSASLVMLFAFLWFRGCHETQLDRLACLQGRLGASPCIVCFDFVGVHAASGGDSPPQILAGTGDGDLAAPFGVWSERVQGAPGFRLLILSSFLAGFGVFQSALPDR